VIAPGGGGTKGWSLAIALLMNTKKRNFPSVNGTSQLSAALKFGVIGIRTVWAATAALENSRSDEVETSIRAWQKNSHGGVLSTQCITSELATGAYRQASKNYLQQRRTFPSLVCG